MSSARLAFLLVYSLTRQIQSIRPFKWNPLLMCIESPKPPMRIKTIANDVAKLSNVALPSLQRCFKCITKDCHIASRRRAPDAKISICFPEVACNVQARRDSDQQTICTHPRLKLPHERPLCNGHLTCIQNWRLKEHLVLLFAPVKWNAHLLAGR